MKKVLLVLLVIVAGFVAVVMSRPATVHVERSATIAAPQHVAYAQVVDFRKWIAWSPWEELDPDMTRTFDGAESGVGAGYHWSGNDDVGEGQMRITEAVIDEKIVWDLEFLKPWKASSVMTLTLTPEEGGTTIRWSMDGNNGFMAKAMSLFMNMDQMIGGDFEKGLGKLGVVAMELAEAGAMEEATGTP